MAQDNFNLKQFLTENKLTTNNSVNVFAEGNYKKEESVEEGDYKHEEEVSEEYGWEKVETDGVAVETLNKIIEEHGLAEVQGYFKLKDDSVAMAQIGNIIEKFGEDAVKDWIENA